MWCKFAWIFAAFCTVHLHDTTVCDTCMSLCLISYSYVIFLIYSPLKDKAETRKQHIMSILLFLVLLIFFLVIVGVAFLLIFLHGGESAQAVGYAYGLGFFTLVSTIVQWLPQIILTIIKRVCIEFTH